MKLSNFSRRQIKEVFDESADVGGGFTRTRIPIKNIFDINPISRSQARRLCRRFENFRMVELDFTDVPAIGQGFAHELFAVFQNSHREVELRPINTSDEVRKMIFHAVNSSPGTPAPPVFPRDSLSQSFVQNSSSSSRNSNS